MKKSFVLSASFPSSKISAERFEKSLAKIKPYGFSVVEYYIEGHDADKTAKMLNGWESVFLSAALQKQAGLNPSSCDAAERARAVELLSESMRFAVQAGSRAVLVNSGTRPDDEKRDTECLKYLRESLCELHRNVGEINILIEPGDRDVEYRHLIGHTDIAVDFIQDIRSDIPGIGLVFDTSHIAQLGEKLTASWEIARGSCSHLHLANCSLVKGTPLYGDKHPPFGIENSVYSHESICEFYQGLEDDLTVGIEIICAEGDEDAFFAQVAGETGWFF